MAYNLFLYSIGQNRGLDILIENDHLSFKIPSFGLFHDLENGSNMNKKIIASIENIDTII